MLGRWTLRPLRGEGGTQAAPAWMRYLLFAGYVGGLATVWTFLPVIILTHVWGTLFGFDRIGAVFGTPLFSVGEREVDLYALASLLGVLGLTVVVNRLVSQYLERQVFRYFDWDQGIRHAIQAVVKYLLLLAGISLGLEFVGIGLGALALFAGVIGIGIGFGLQSIANNFISGLIILFERPLKKGDFVDAGGLEGRVEEIRARATTLVTRDNVSVIVPNSELAGGRVVNWSHGSETVRLHVDVGVAYGSNLERATRVLLDIAAAHPKALSDPKPEVYFTSFGDSALQLRLLFWTNDVRGKFGTLSEIHYAIDAGFRAAGVTIPFPQRDVHMRSPAPAAGDPPPPSTTTEADPAS